MKRLAIVMLCLLILGPVSAWAVDEQTVEQLQTEVISTKSKADINENKIKNLEGGLPAEQAARELADAALRTQIDNIELIPGPQGPQGPPGPMGLQGPPGTLESSVMEALLARIAYLESMTIHADMDNDGVSLSDGDCNDINASINPFVQEIASDGVDNNCDGVIADFDLDGYTTDAGDCNDLNPDISPGVLDVPGDGIDNNCDGIFPDFDLDGFTIVQGDCDDENPNINPAVEDVVGDGLDNNCDGFVDATWSESVVLNEGNQVGILWGTTLNVGPSDSATAFWEQDDKLNARGFDIGNGWAALSELGISGYLEDVVTDALGNIFVLWDQNNTLYASRYSPDQGWGTAKALQSGSSYFWLEGLDVDNLGNAFAIWRYRDEGDSYYSLYASRFTPESGWSNREPLEFNDAGTAYLEALEVDNLGNAFIVYEQPDGTVKNLYSKIYTPDYGWGTAVEIEAVDDLRVYLGSLTVDNNGNAIVLWTQPDSDSNIQSLYARHYIDGTGWGEAISLESSTGRVASISLKTDDLGNTFAVWRQQDEGASQYSVYANNYNHANGWSSPVLLEVNDTYAHLSSLVVDDKGNAFVAWEQDSNGLDTLFVSRYSQALGWGAAVAVDSTNTYLTFTGVEIDNAGNAFVYWRTRDSSVSLSPYSLFVRRYAIGYGWGEIVPLESSDDDTSSYMFEINADVAGNAIAVWKQSGEDYEKLFARYYIPSSGWSEAGLVDYVTDNEHGSYSALSDLEIDFLSTDKPLLLWSKRQGDTYGGATTTLFSKHLVR